MDNHCSLVYFSNQLPWDHLGTHLRRLQALSKDRRHAILKAFFDEATYVLHGEVAQLPAALQAEIQPFESIVDFGFQSQLRDGQLGGSFEGVLLCLLQLGTYIRYHFFDFSMPVTKLLMSF